MIRCTSEGSLTMTFMLFRALKQVEEALSEKNRYYCSLALGREVTDGETLMRYFCGNGGAIDFERRFNEAFSDQNRYYCSLFYGFCVEDEQTIWDYYNDHALTTAFHSPLQTSNYP